MASQREDDRLMQVLSINVGLPRDAVWRGHAVRTSIYKAPVAGRVRVTELNVAGDEQSDLSVHGGHDKAVYAYPSEHYAWWRSELPDMDLPWGMFGENLTTSGLLEQDLQIGDRLRAGSAEFMVTQPRIPCYKLSLRFGRADMVKRFERSGRSGFYLRVVQEGEVASGDRLELIARQTHGMTVATLAHLYVADGANKELLRRATDLPVLPQGWRDHFRERLGAGQ